MERGLDEAGIKYVRDRRFENTVIVLDFYLPDYDIYIEVKQFHSDRMTNQLKAYENVILIQGKKAAEAFVKMITLKTS